MRADLEDLAAFGEEFFAPLPLLSVALFALNNALLKQACPGFLTGKLSDITACFFLPLFVSALLELATWRTMKPGVRIAAGVSITALIFVPVKLDDGASRLLTRLVDSLGVPLGFPASTSIADPTDLLALPFLGLAVWFVARRSSRAPQPA